MQNFELMRDFSRGTYKKWTDKLVNAAQDKCTEYIPDIAQCIRKQKETTITLDTSKRPDPTPIYDEHGAIKDYIKVDPIAMKDWERETTNYDKRKAAYDSNKMSICSIVKDSIDPYFTDKLNRHSDYEDNQDSLVWLLTTIKAFCSYNNEEQDATLGIVNAHVDFLTFRQHDKDIIEFKQLFLQKFGALKDHKMALGAIEAITEKYSSGTAAAKKEKALEQYAATVVIRNAGSKYDSLRSDLHNRFAQGATDAYPDTVLKAFDLLQKYKPPSNGGRNNNNRSSNTRNADNSDSANNADNRDRRNTDRNGGNCGRNNAHGSDDSSGNDE